MVLEISILTNIKEFFAITITASSIPVNTKVVYVPTVTAEEFRVRINLLICSLFSEVELGDLYARLMARAFVSVSNETETACLN